MRNTAACRSPDRPVSSARHRRHEIVRQAIGERKARELFSIKAKQALRCPKPGVSFRSADHLVCGVYEAVGFANHREALSVETRNAQAGRIHSMGKPD